MAHYRPRPLRAQIRNPVLGLPTAITALASLDADANAALRAALCVIRDDARIRAESSWRSHKAPMAVYWKCVAVYSNHIQRALAQIARTPGTPARGEGEGGA